MAAYLHFVRGEAKLTLGEDSGSEGRSICAHAVAIAELDNLAHVRGYAFDEAPMSGRHFPIRSFVGSVVLVAAAASVYLSYELVVKPRRALQDQIREQKGTILKLEQEKQRLETYLKILKHIDRRARVEVLRQTKDQQGSLQTTIRFTEVDDAGKPINVSREMTLPGQEVYFDTLVIKFDDHFIEQGDPVKGGALMLFRRVCTQEQTDTARAEYRRVQPKANARRAHLDSSPITP
jgi:hypothetical protein